MKKKSDYILFFISIFFFITCFTISIILLFFNNILEANCLIIFSLLPFFYYLDKFSTPKFLIGPAFFFYIIHLLGYSIGPFGQKYLLTSTSFLIDGMVLAQRGAILGLLIFLIVYYFVFKKIRVNSKTNLNYIENIDQIKWVRYTKLLLFITILQLIFNYLSGGIRRIGVSELDESSILTKTLVSSFLYVQFVLFFFLGILLIKFKNPWRLITITFYLIYISFYILEGNRGQVVTSTILLFSGMVWVGYPVKKVLYKLLIFLILFIPLTSVIDLYRSVTTSSDYEAGFFERLKSLTLVAEDIGASSKENKAIASQVFLSATTAHTVDKIMIMTPNQIPYSGFDNLSAIFFVYVPLIIYPNRPDIDDGNIIAYEYGVGQGKGARSFEYTPSVGDGYRRFGWLGILLIYFLIGSFFSIIIKVAYFNSNKPEWAALLFFVFIQISTAWAFTFNNLMHFFLFVVLRYFIFFKILTHIKCIKFSLNLK